MDCGVRHDAGSVAKKLISPVLDCVLLYIYTNAGSVKRTANYFEFRFPSGGACGAY